MSIPETNDPSKPDEITAAVELALHDAWFPAIDALALWLRTHALADLVVMVGSEGHVAAGPREPIAAMFAMVPDTAMLAAELRKAPADDHVWFIVHADGGVNLTQCEMVIPDTAKAMLAMTPGGVA